jgi:replicative DNA helicase
VNDRSPDFLSRPAPSDLQAEISIIGAILVRPELLPAILQLVAPPDLSDTKAAAAYAAQIRSFCENSPADDPITLVDSIRSVGDLEKFGDAKEATVWLANVAASVPDPTHGLHYARIVHDIALRRDFGRIAYGLALESFDAADAREFLINAQSEFAKIYSRQAPDRPATAEMLRQTLANLAEEDRDCMSTGFPDLDRVLGGGFRPGELIVLAAPTGQGKSTFALNIAANCARAGRGAIFFSLEMREAENARRLLFSESRINHLRLATPGGLTLDESERLRRVVDTFAGLKLEIQYRPGLNPITVRAIAQRFREQWRGNLGLVVCDYIGLMRSDERQERREREVASITRELKLTAAELDCTILAVAQLNREIAHRDDGRPRLSDLRDSGAIEQDADVVAFIHHEPGSERAEIVIEKNRRGPRTKVALVHRAGMTRFDAAGESAW